MVERMERSYETGENFRARPNAYTYTSLIKLYGRHVKSAEGAERAEGALRRMGDLHDRTGFDDVRPNAYAYTA
eukprot:CAMPEP_0183323628 /NCGR_PEP_ID=MMETSP0160_2-20130417/74925_1 /TAXON_ID=2839 ORGANISM="Odontella Sinensis, Strain Grunow 1884" /NCGR_SAMPLE_ID=MMETSP0160_2 /ASSEMBLY_ACC=CAM_ASM_000250 /LENGTH=72 /DNA_ID=CAMNT_0025491047 /DNA_START=1 /DNA_END=216 /DNA_ORIENTATION=-